MYQGMTVSRRMFTRKRRRRISRWRKLPYASCLNSRDCRSKFDAMPRPSMLRRRVKVGERVVGAAGGRSGAERSGPLRPA